MNSSWIESIRYKKLPDGSSYVAIFLKDKEKFCGSCNGRGWVKTSRGPCEECLGKGRVNAQSALLYGGPDSPIPSWLPGLIQAGTGGRSIGHAYHKLVKGKFPSQRVEGREKVQELRRIMS